MSFNSRSSAWALVGLPHFYNLSKGYLMEPLIQKVIMMCSCDVPVGGSTGICLGEEQEKTGCCRFAQEQTGCKVNCVIPPSAGGRVVPLLAEREMR